MITEQKMFQFDLFLNIRLTTGTRIMEASIPIDPACGTILGPQSKKRTRQIANPPTAAEIAPNLFVQLLNMPQIKGPRATDAIAPQEITRIVTMIAGFIYARIIARRMNTTLLILIILVKVLSEAFLLMNPLYISSVRVALDTRTRAASVDLEADKISNNMMTVRAGGITVEKSSGIKASNLGTPAIKASGLWVGVINILVRAPVK